jgi:hypothetical protein
VEGVTNFFWGFPVCSTNLGEANFSAEFGSGFKGVQFYFLGYCQGVLNPTVLNPRSENRP